MEFRIGITTFSSLVSFLLARNQSSIVIQQSRTKYGMNRKNFSCIIFFFVFFSKAKKILIEKQKFQKRLSLKQDALHSMKENLRIVQESETTKMVIVTLIAPEILTHFMSLVSFFTPPWKHKNIFGFMIISGGIERDQWHEID